MELSRITFKELKGTCTSQGCESETGHRALGPRRHSEADHLKHDCRRESFRNDCEVEKMVIVVGRVQFTWMGGFWGRCFPSIRRHPAVPCSTCTCVPTIPSTTGSIGFGQMNCEVKETITSVGKDLSRCMRWGPVFPKRSVVLRLEDMSCTLTEKPPPNPSSNINLIKRNPWVGSDPVASNRRWCWADEPAERRDHPLRWWRNMQ